MWFKYNKRKSSGSYNRRGWVDILIIMAMTVTKYFVQPSY